jgi:Ca2+-binding EF-hand superfamily protein
MNPKNPGCMVVCCFVAILWVLGSHPESAAQDARAERRDDAPKSVTSDAKPAAGPDSTLALALLGSLTPDHMKQLGQMLDQDWKSRPEWGDMALAILKGERMRMGAGWWRPGVKRYDWSWLRGHFDSDSNGLLDREEFPESGPKCATIFARLDRDGDGKVSASDLDLDSTDPSSAPINMMANVLFSRWDTDSNGRISADELIAFFARSDDESLGFLTPEDLRSALDDPSMRRQQNRAGGGEPPPAEMLRMFLSGQLGWLEAGPEYGERAPDFTLPTHDGSGTVTLYESLAKKPAVLIFGSFT